MVSSPPVQGNPGRAAFPLPQRGGEFGCGVAFQGGEPTLRGLPFFRRLIELEKAHNSRGLPIHNAIQTNGMVLDLKFSPSFLESSRHMDALRDLINTYFHNSSRY